MVLHYVDVWREIRLGSFRLHAIPITPLYYIRVRSEARRHNLTINSILNRTQPFIVLPVMQVELFARLVVKDILKDVFGRHRGVSRMNFTLVSSVFLGMVRII